MGRPRDAWRHRISAARRTLVVAFGVLAVLGSLPGLFSPAGAQSDGEAPPSGAPTPELYVDETGPVTTGAGSGDSGDTGTDRDAPTAFLDVVEIDGPIDAIVRDFVFDALDRAENDPRLSAILLRLNTPGTLGTDGFALAERVRDSRVPVITWVGAPGADASGAGVLLLAASQYAGMAQNTTVGPLNPEDLKSNVNLNRAEARRQLEAVLNDQAGDRSVDAYLKLLESRMDPEEARGAGIVEFVQPTIGETLVEINAQTVVLSTGEVVTIDTVELLPEDERAEGEPGLVPTVITRFWRLAGIEGFLHKLNTPTYAYVLLVIGLGAIAFEFFAASIGLAGIAGGIVLIGSFLSMGNLPVNWWAVALIGLAILLMSIDVQLANLGILTIAGTAAAVVGSVFFTYSGVYRVHWWAIALVLVCLLLFYAIAMTTVAKTRFSTPTIGRGHLLGAGGVAYSDLAPEGLVEIEGAVWKGRSHRGKIPCGSDVSVRAIDGLVLEVDEGAPDADADSVEPEPAT